MILSRLRGVIPQCLELLFTRLLLFFNLRRPTLEISNIPLKHLTDDAITISDECQDSSGI